MSMPYWKNCDEATVFCSMSSMWVTQGLLIFQYFGSSLLIQQCIPLVGSGGVHTRNKWSLGWTL